MSAVETLNSQNCCRIFGTTAIPNRDKTKLLGPPNSVDQKQFGLVSAPGQCWPQPVLAKASVGPQPVLAQVSVGPQPVLAQASSGEG